MPPAGGDDLNLMFGIGADAQPSMDEMERLRASTVAGVGAISAALDGLAVQTATVDTPKILRAYQEQGTAATASAEAQVAAAERVVTAQSTQNKRWFEVLRERAAAQEAADRPLTPRAPAATEAELSAVADSADARYVREEAQAAKNAAYLLGLRQRYNAEVSALEERAAREAEQSATRQTTAFTNLFARLTGNTGYSTVINQLRGVSDAEGEAATRLRELYGIESEAAAGAASLASGLAPVAIGLGAVALATVGVVALAWSAAGASSAAGDEIYKVGQKSSFTAEALSTLRLVSSEQNVEFGKFSTTLPLFERNLDLAAAGNHRLAEAFLRVGVVAADFKGRPQEAFNQFLKGFGELLPEDERRATLATQLFSRAGADLIPVFDQLKDGIGTADARTAALGQRFTSDGVESAHRYEVAVRDLEARIAGFSNTVGQQTTPVINRLIDQIDAGLGKTGSFGTLIGANLASALEVLGDGILGVERLTTVLYELIAVPVSLFIGTVGAAFKGLKTEIFGVAEVARQMVLEFARIIGAWKEGSIKDLFGAIQKSEDDTIATIENRLLQMLTDIQNRVIVARDAILGINTQPVPESAVEKPAGEKTSLTDFNAKATATVADPGEQTNRLRSMQAEAARIAAEQIATEENALKINKKSYADATNAIIEALQTRAKAEQDAIALRKNQLNDELAYETGTDDKAKAARQRINQELEALDSDALNKKSELDREVAARRTQVQVQERDAEVAHRNALLQITLGAEKAVQDGVRALVAAGTLDREAGNRQLEESEERAFKARADRLRQELDEAGAEPARRQAVRDKIAALDNERTLLAQQQSERRRKIAEEELATTVRLAQQQGEAALRAMEDNSRAQIASIEEAARRRQTSQERAARVGVNAQLGTFPDREAFLRASAAADLALEIDADKRKAIQNRLNADLAALTAERLRIQAEGERAIAAGRDQDLANLLAYRDRSRALGDQVVAAQLDQQQRVIDDLLRQDARRADVIELRRQHDADAARAAHEQALRALHDQELVDLATTKGLEDSERKQDDIRKKYAALRKAEDDRDRAERKRIQDEATKEQERRDPNSTRGLFGDTFADAIKKGATNLQALGSVAAEVFGQMSDDAGNFTTILAGGVQRLVGGLGSVIENFITTGRVGKEAFRSLAVEILAHYAATFAIKAIDLLAEGFGNEAKASAAFAAGDFAGGFLYQLAAKQDFLGAAKYGGGAIAAGVAGLAFSSGAKSRDTATGTTGTGTGTTSSSGTGTPQTINVGRPAPQIIQLHIVSNDSHIVSVVDQNMKSAGTLRDNVIEIQVGNA